MLHKHNVTSVQEIAPPPILHSPLLAIGGMNTLLWVCFSNETCHYGALIVIKAISQYGCIPKSPAHTSGVR